MGPKSPSTHKVSPPSQIPIVSLWLSCSPRVTLLWPRYYKSLISFKFIENIPKIPKFLKSLNFSNSILRIPNPLIFLNISNSIPSIPKFLNSLTNQFEQFSNQFSNQFPIKNIKEIKHLLNVTSIKSHECRNSLFFLKFFNEKSMTYRKCSQNDTEARGD